MSKRVKVFIVSLVLLAGFFATADFALAQVDVGANFAAKTGLAAMDPRVVIARIIQIFLGFLGIIALGLIMYGGYLWMTSAGDENQVQKAKDVLRNAIIGIVIILSAFGIVSFLLAKIMDATGPDNGNGPGGAKGIGGSGVLGSCSVESVYPTPDQREVPRNTSVIISFKEEIDSATVCATVDGSGRCNGSNILTDGTVKIYKTGDEPSAFLTDVKVYDTADHKTFVFVPGTYLGSPSEYIWYTAYVGSGVSKPDGRSIFENCAVDYMQWQFEVSNKIDLTPPQVKERGVFPSPDNGRDTSSVISAPSQAAGSITVVSQPNIYTPASAGSVAGATVTIDPNCSEQGTLNIVVATDGLTAQLSNAGRLLGSAVFNGRTVTFNGVLSLTLSTDPAAGNSWSIPVTAARPADTLTVGRMVYVFVSDATTPNHIQRGTGISQTVANIAAALNDRTDIRAVVVGNRVDVRAVLAGVSGNNIVLNSSNTASLSVVSLSGGANRNEQVSIVGRKDQPMNTVIQINFNEAILPTTVVGNADQVSNYIKVVNAKTGAAAEGGSCSIDADCQSFKCDGGSCVGSNNYLPGKFKISNQYRTVEFVSDNQCGVNGCGDPIYCLPANSQLRVVLTAAGLATCSSPSDCASKSPYNTCSTQPQSGSLSVCRQDFGGNYAGSRSRSYPVSNTSFDGVMDAAFNSFDGDRNTFADGPISTFSDNPVSYPGSVQCQADFSRIATAVVNKRMELNKTLGDITGPFWAAGPCTTPASCEARMTSIMQALGVTGSIKDSGGALFYFNEREDSLSGGACVHDELYSANCGSIQLPFYFCANGDNYSFSFFISDKMEISAPVLETVLPVRASSIAIADEVSGQFSKMMMSSTLSTGETKINNGQEVIAHKNLNLWSLADKTIGYWVENEGVDINNDGEMEKTKVYIRHNLLDASVSYRAQMGSGIKDIYQNCFKPSGDLTCGVSETNPSCCNGVPRSTLGQNGNCQ